jgi:hypothetical protein
VNVCSMVMSDVPGDERSVCESVSVCLSVCMSVCMSVCLCVSLCLYVCLSVCFHVILSISSHNCVSLFVDFLRILSSLFLIPLSCLSSPPYPRPGNIETFESSLSMTVADLVALAVQRFGVADQTQQIVLWELNRGGVQLLKGVSLCLSRYISRCLSVSLSLCLSLCVPSVCCDSCVVVIYSS